MLIVAALLAPGSAWAAAGDVGCIATKLGAPIMQRIGNGVAAAVTAGSDPARALDTDRDAFIAARDACRSAHNWSPDAVEAAVSYTQARATKLGVESALKAEGADTAKLNGIYDGLLLADRKSLIAKVSSSVLRVIAAAGANPTQRRHVLLYFAALAGLEFYPADFTAA
ncbi:MAG: hypothetical protein ABIQ43_01590 [Sphingomonas sp.]